MAALTLAQLLATPTKELVRERLFGKLNLADFPVTDFEEGATVRTVVESEAEALFNMVASLIPQIAAGGYMDEAVEDWLRLLAQQNYLIDYRPASYTVEAVQFTVASGAGPHSVNPGDLVVEATSGRRYNLAEAGTLGAGPSTTTLLCKAESPGAAYADGAGTIRRLITSLPGVTVNNPSPTYSKVAHQGPGLGTLVLTGTPTVARYSLRITSSGAAGTATFEYSRDGSVYVVGGLTIAAPGYVTLPNGARVGFQDGGVAAASFREGDTYVFSSPGSPIVEQGRDDETDSALRVRMRERWSLLSEVATDDVYEAWAKESSLEITKAKAFPENSAATPGRVRIVIAGAVNPIAGSTVAICQTYIDERHSTTDHPVVSAADAAIVGAIGNVKVAANQLAVVQAKAQADWNSYLRGLDMGADIVDSRLEQILMNAGAIDVDALAVIVAATSYDVYHLGATEVAEPDSIPLSTWLTWLVV